ncbi:MAG: ABC transporter ATP-binding protein [Bacteroidota bacterium]
MHESTLLTTYLRNFISFIKPSGLIRILMVNSLQGITQGVGIVFILPLLQLLNPAAESGDRIVQAIHNFFERLSVPLTIETVVLVYVVLVIFSLLLRYYQRILSSSYTQGYISHLRVDLFDKLSHARWAFLQGQKRSYFVHALTQDINQVGLTTYNLLRLFSTLLIILFNIIVALMIAPWFTLMTLAFAVLMAFISKPLMKKAHSFGYLSRRFHRHIYNSASEMLYGLKNIKSHHQEDELYDNFRETSGSMVNHVLGFIRTQAVTRTLHGILSVVVLGAYLLVSVKLIGIGISTLLIMIVIFGRLVPKFTGLVSFWQNVKNALPAFEGLNALSQEAGESREPGGIHVSQSMELRQELSLQGVHYHYPDAFSVQDLSLSIKARSIVAIAGASGSGKTTTADIITGLLRPSKGQVLVDQQPLEGDRVFQWRNSISYITQEAYFFNDTIRNNLLFGIDRKPGDEEIWSVLHDCFLKETIQKMDAGLDTEIGDQGSLLSGGERQRLAIARALIRRPTLLILDEATSALDYSIERELYRLFFKLKQQMTVVIIAHRLSTIKAVDQIFVLKEGMLAEYGDWNALSSKSHGVLQKLMEQGE